MSEPRDNRGASLDQERAADFADLANLANLENLPDDGPLKIWTSVPDGAVLELSVVTRNPHAAAVGRFVSRLGAAQVWPSTDIQPGPKRERLAATDLGYVLNIVTAFAADDPRPVGVFARILVSPGVVFGTPYFHRVTGGRGDFEITTILIDMQ